MRIDPYTGEEFIPKRNNQLFASRKNQVAYNNLKSRNKRYQKQQVLKVLDKNHKLLIEALQEQDTVDVPIQDLKDLGYDFNYITHQLQPKDSKEKVYGVFNLGISRINDSQIKVSKL